MDANSTASTFLFGTLLVMAVMGAITRSISGAFLGLTVVLIGASIYLFNQGGISIVGGVVFGVFALLALFLTLVLSINVSHSEMSRFHPDGSRDYARHTVVGQGAAQSYSRWGSDTPRLGSGGHAPNSYPQIGSGSQKMIGDAD